MIAHALSPIVPQDISATGLPGTLVQAKVEDPNTLTTATVHPLSLTSEGRLRVEMDAAQRRLAEAHTLELLEQSYRNFLGSELFSSERRGYELR